MTWLALLGMAGLTFVLVRLVRERYERFLDQYRNLDAKGVESYLRMLLKRGRDGAFLIVEDMDSERFVQFRKYLRRSSAGIECHFPDAPWSASYYARIADRLRASNLDFEELDANERPTHGFLRIDFGKDVTAATRFLQDVFVAVFGVAAIKVRVRSHGISSRDEAIGPV